MASVKQMIPGGAFKPRGTQRESGMIASIRRYTQFVNTTKFILLILSLGLIGMIVLLPVINSSDDGMRLAFSAVGEKDDSLPMMTNPTFQGVDEKNQPYFVTADNALQADERTIVIDNVQADMVTEENSWLSVKATRGVIDNQAKLMQLLEDVRLYHQDGFEFRTTEVAIDMNARTAKGTKPIHGFGPMGELDAQAFDWDHDARLMRFTGGVEMKVMPK